MAENKKPDSVESGSAMEGDSGGTPAAFALRAPHHRRRANPCQRTRLTAVIFMTVAATRAWTARFIARPDVRAPSFPQA